MTVPANHTREDEDASFSSPANLQVPGSLVASGIGLCILAAVFAHHTFPALALLVLGGILCGTGTRMTPPDQGIKGLFLRGIGCFTTLVIGLFVLVFLFFAMSAWDSSGFVAH